MKVKNKYTYLQKYIFYYFEKLGYYFLSKQDILRIPKIIHKNTTVFLKKFGLYTNVHALNKEELCLILEKYFYGNTLLSIAPLTKYLHLNFIFLKSKDKNYYKIKINYIFATPRIQKQIREISFELSNKWSLLGTDTRTEELKRLLGTDGISAKTRKTLTKIKLHKFLHLIKQTKFQRTHQFFNFLKHTKQTFNFWNKISKYNYPQFTKSAITIYGFRGPDHEPYEEIIETFDYLETTKFDYRTHIYQPLEILTLNLFKIMKINNDFDLFVFLFYNYCMLQNIYINEKNQIIQIIQNDINKQNLIKIAASYHNNTTTNVYNSILLPAIPIEEVILGDIHWLFENLHPILDIMCDLLPFYLNKATLLTKFSNILCQQQLKTLIFYIQIYKLPTKEVILTKKEYSQDTPMYNWTTCLVIYLLKLNNLHTHLPIIYECMHFFNIDLENLLKYTNIYAENLYNKPFFKDFEKSKRKKFLETTKFVTF